MRKVSIKTKKGFVALVDQHLIFDDYAMPVNSSDIPHIKKRLAKYNILECSITPYKNNDFTIEQKIEICQMRRNVRCKHCLRYERKECDLLYGK